jgi:hypothetical protein
VSVLASAASTRVRSVLAPRSVEEEFRILPLLIARVPLTEYQTFANDNKPGKQKRHLTAKERKARVDSFRDSQIHEHQDGLDRKGFRGQPKRDRDPHQRFERFRIRAVVRSGPRLVSPRWVQRSFRSWSSLAADISTKLPAPTRRTARTDRASSARARRAPERR